MANVSIRIGSDDGRPNCQKKSMNSAPATLCSICGGRSPSSIAEPMKLAAKPIISTSGVTGSFRARASGSATGAIIRITTTLSTNIEITPASTDRIITSQPGRPPDSRRACTDSQLGTPVLPKYEAMIQTLTRIAITFQSTSPKASTSVITPTQIITTTPISAATALSTALTITAMIVTRKMPMASQAIVSMSPAPLLLVPPPHGGHRRGFSTRRCRHRWAFSRYATAVPRSPVADARQPTGCIRTRPFSSSIVLASSLTSA